MSNSDKQITYNKYRDQVYPMLANRINEMIKTVEIRECLLYALEGGKYVRACMYMIVLDQIKAEMTIKQYQLIKSAAVYIEFIHAASLILDDMPHMDNDLTRRGRPSVHAKFGKAKAQLSAFVLIQVAHKTISNIIMTLHRDEHYMTTDQYCFLQFLIYDKHCDFLGEDGLAGGQYADLFLMNNGTLEKYMTMIEGKTSRLFELAVTLPYLLVMSAHQLDDAQIEQHRQIGRDFGIVFQLLDDIIDYEPNISLGNNVLDYTTMTKASELLCQHYYKCTETCTKLSLNFEIIWAGIGDAFNTLLLKTLQRNVAPSPQAEPLRLSPSTASR